MPDMSEMSPTRRGLKGSAVGAERWLSTSPVRPSLFPGAPVSHSSTSLVTTPTSARRSCAACASRRVTEITMTLTDGSEVDFVSCHACEHRAWSASGDVLEITDVLGRARKVVLPTQQGSGGATPLRRRG